MYAAVDDEELRPGMVAVIQTADVLADRHRCRGFSHMVLSISLCVCGMFEVPISRRTGDGTNDDRPLGISSTAWSRLTSMIRSQSVGAGMLLSVAVILTFACGADRPRVLILGIDGLDPDAIELLMAEGALPNFSALKHEGAAGTLKANEPLISPVLWTTIATGKPPLEHGIGHFVAIDSDTGEAVPATSNMRRVEALWNIASRQERRVATVGWWATWPPEPINGAVVSDRTCYHFLFGSGTTDSPGEITTYPTALIKRLSHLVRRPQDIGPTEAKRYVSVDDSEFDGEFNFTSDLNHLQWALATADTYRDIGLHLWRDQAPELEMVYIESTDSISHLFGHLFRVDGLAGDLAIQQGRYGNTVEAIYRYADDLVGRYLQVIDDRTTLIVLSDHGFALGALHDDPSLTRSVKRVSADFHREDGVILIFGHQVRRGSRPVQASQLDIAPTVLALLDLDVPRDMPGRVLTECLLFEAPERILETYEPPDRTDRTSTHSLVDDQIKARLRSLGYIDDSKKEPARESLQSARTMATLLFKAERYEEASRVFRQLIEQSPKDPALYVDLAACLGAMGRYEEALEQIATSLELDPVNPEAHQNRGAALERLGRPQEAVEAYRAASSYSPDLESARDALLRLTGSTEVHPPRDSAERAVRELLASAEIEARHGDFAAATTLLEEAERLAPAYVPVHQYRANVAFLMGDIATAKRALRKALELEPDNALLRANLEALLDRHPDR